MKRSKQDSFTKRDGRELSQYHLFKIEAVEGFDLVFNETNPPTLPSFREL